jgi:hypothetical protein
VKNVRSKDGSHDYNMEEVMNKSAEKELATNHRKRLTLVVTVLAAAIVTGFGACSSATSNQNEVAKSSATPMPTAPTPTSSLAAVEGVGQHGENLYDLAKAGDWHKAATEFTALLQSEQQLRNKMKDKSADLERLNQALTAAGRAVEMEDRITTMREANLITLIGADLAAAFHPPVQVEVTRLDYYGRELELWSAGKNEAQLRETAEGLRRTWMTLRPLVESRGSAAEAKKFGELVSQVEAAKTPTDFGKLATPILDEVDNLEKVFMKH